MRMKAIIPAWARILQGYRPFLSIEITKECPLRCPGCYAFASGHLNNGIHTRDLTDWRGEDLVERVLMLVRHYRPLHVSFVGGEPLVRLRELTCLIRELDSMKIETQIVTSAVCAIPIQWKEFANLHIAVSVDGLQPEHDSRRAPATYDRILRHIEGFSVIVHCTLTPRCLEERGYLEKFAGEWSSKSGVSKIWFSLYTPQAGENSPERLSPAQREVAIDRIATAASLYPKVYAPGLVLHGFRNPPASPRECIFAQTTHCVAADLSTSVVPCQIGGRPECSECGCMAAAGLAAIGRFKLAGFLKVSRVFESSQKLGEQFRSRNEQACAHPAPAEPRA